MSFLEAAIDRLADDEIRDYRMVAAAGRLASLARLGALDAALEGSSKNGPDREKLVERIAELEFQLGIG